MESSTPARILILDACRNNPFSGRSRGISGGLAPSKVRPGTFISYAAAPEGIALDAVEGSEHSPFALALLKYLPVPGIDIDEVFFNVRRYVSQITHDRQHPWVSTSLIEKIYLAAPPVEVAAIPNENTLRKNGGIQLDPSLQRFLGSDAIEINGHHTSPDRLSDTLQDSDIRNGLNLIQTAGQQLLAWYEDYELKKFEDPYHNSYAVIVAIDKYSHGSDSHYRDLPFMVQNARQLANTLLTLGFPNRNILTLYDSDASSNAIDRTLKEFWESGRYQDADRVVFYFGGHGDRIPSDTIDVDSSFSAPQRPAPSLYGYNPVEVRKAAELPRQSAWPPHQSLQGLNLAKAQIPAR